MLGSRSAPSSGGSRPTRKTQRASVDLPSTARSATCTAAAVASTPTLRRRSSSFLAPRASATASLAPGASTLSDGVTPSGGANSRRSVTRPSLAGTPASGSASQSSSRLRPKKPLASPLVPLVSLMGVARVASSLGSRSSLADAFHVATVSSYEWSGSPLGAPASRTRT